MISKEKQKEYNQRNYLKNRERTLLKNEEYRQKNIEKITIQRKRQYQENKELIIQKALKYEKENQESITLRRKLKRQAFRLENPLPINRGSYNITLAERYKEEWLKETLFVYHIKMIEENGVVFYKYGLTKHIKSRMHKIPYKVEILEILELNKYEAIYKEYSLLQNKVQYSPIKAFKGYTECYI